MFRFLPEPASEIAEKVDGLNNLITDLSVLFTVLIVGAMLYFAFRYRKRDGKDHPTPRILGSHFLEAVWTVVPTLVCIYLAVQGVQVYKEMRYVEPGALEIQVRGQKWFWDFEYSTGKKTVGEFIVPVNKPVKLVLQSKDVLHSFFIPSMRVKSDAVPGYYTYVTFKPIRTGEFRVYCTEYCGRDHSFMMANLKVVSETEYERWVNDLTEKADILPPVEKGKALYMKNCTSCHTIDGTPRVGPTFLKIYDKKGKLTDGTDYVADDNYIRTSILNPNAAVVSGFAKPSQMTSFEGLLKDDDITAIITFIKTLDGTQKVELPTTPVADTANMTPAERGKVIYQTKACVGCHSLDGSKVVGPSFKGAYGNQGKFSDGTSYVIDDAYITESILDPNAHVVEGFPVPSLMPPYSGQLSEGDVKDVIEFLKTVK